MRTVRVRTTYPGREVAEVRDLLADPHFRQAVCEFQQVADSSVSIQQYDDGSMIVDLTRTYDTAVLPSIAQSLVGRTIDLVQREEWSATSRATAQLTIPGQPARMSGRCALDQTGADTAYTADLEVRVSIPLLGGRIEEVVADLVGQAFRAENHVGVQWLAGTWPR